MGHETSPATAGLAVMLDEPVKLELSAETIELRPLRLRQFGQLLGVLPPALAQFFGTFDGFEKWAQEANLLDIVTGELKLSGRALAPVFSEVVARAATLPPVFDKLIEATAIASDRKKEWVSDLNMADAVTLVGKLWELNADFFVQSVWPSMMTMVLSSPTSGRSSIEPPRQRTSEPSPAGRESSSA